MSRIVAEEHICLVFGGGGAHGLSNLGVVRALIELGIPIDVIGGTSIGSIFAGALSMDWPFEYVYDSMKKDISKNNPLTDYTIPFVALLRGRRMTKTLKKYFDIPIENTWKNHFCVAANLSKYKTEILQSGHLYKAIAASVSIPGILPPSLYKNSILVDGGVLNNLPSDIMHELYHGHIISVDVVANKPRTINHDYRMGNNQFLRNAISGKKKNYVPGTMDTIMKSITLASAEKWKEKQRVSDYYLQPRTKKPFLAWKAMNAFVEEGYNVSMESIKSSNYKEQLNLPGS
jgi:predicted acylesterase/phospholipase RssA